MNKSPAALSVLTIRDLRLVPVEVPMTFALGTSADTIRLAPLLLIDLETEEGVTGRTYLFCYRRSGARAIAEILRDALDVVKGRRVAPVEIGALLGRRFALIGVTGVVRMALSGLDAVLWDALANAAGVPLASLLGAGPKPVHAYNSSGLGLIGADAAAEEAVKLLEGGFKAVKLRLGYATVDEDLAVTRAVRKRLPDEIALMVDYNQALSVAEALRRGRALESEGLYWLEEPIRHDDYAGNASIARALALPVQIGENFDGPTAMADAIAADACDYVMPDLGRIGGVTGWVHAAGIAAARGIEMSSHLFPEVSCHLLAATPTCGWLEYVDWANPILQEPLAVRAGQVVVSTKPGSGMEWDEQAIERYRVE
jgi:mandelate racemase